MLWTCDEDCVKKCMEYSVEGRGPVGRPRRTWLDSVEVDMTELEINRRCPWHSTSSYLLVCFLFTSYEQRHNRGMHVDTVVAHQGNNKGNYFIFYHIFFYCLVIYILYTCIAHRKLC